jgi:hypothetical protein
MQLRAWPHVSSNWGSASIELGISTPPPQAEESLPERYGIPLFEALIVDPEYIFLSWEVTEEQLRIARDLFGSKGFLVRRMIAVLENEHGGVLAEYELYGETGRWFIRHNQFGEIVRFKLKFTALGQTLELNETKLLQLPRIYAVEPEFYQEIEVIYGIGGKGQLVLKGFLEDKTAPWPSVTLEPPEFEYQLDGAGTSAAGQPLSGLPGSPAGGWLPSSMGEWISSPKTGKQFSAGEPLAPPASGLTSEAGSGGSGGKS